MGSHITEALVTFCQDVGYTEFHVHTNIVLAMVRHLNVWHASADPWPPKTAQVLFFCPQTSQEQSLTFEAESALRHAHLHGVKPRIVAENVN